MIRLLANTLLLAALGWIGWVLVEIVRDEHRAGMDRLRSVSPDDDQAARDRARFYDRSDAA